MSRIEFRLSGSGGQGILLMGIIIAESAIQKGSKAIQSQSYGPEARGGASKCEVIISEEDIDFPKVLNPNYIVALTQIAADKYLVNLEKDTIIILDDNITVPETCNNKNIYSLPIINTAFNKLRRGITANIITLGALYKISKFIDKETLINSILSRIPKGTEELNIKAFEEGMNLVK